MRLAARPYPHAPSHALASQTRKGIYLHDLTPSIREEIAQAGLVDGQVTVLSRYVCLEPLGYQVLPGPGRVLC